MNLSIEKEFPCSDTCTFVLGDVSYHTHNKTKQIAEEEETEEGCLETGEETTEESWVRTKIRMELEVCARKGGYDIEKKDSRRGYEKEERGEGQKMR